MTAPSPCSRALLGALTAILLGLLSFTAPLAQAAPFAYIGNQNGNNVSVIDIATNTVIATVPVGTYPHGVAVNPAGTRAYVVTLTGVSVINTATNTTIATVAVGSAPQGVAVNPAGTRAYVTNSISNNVSVIDTASNSVVATVTVGIDPRGVAVNPAGTRAYVVNRSSNTVSVIDATDNTVVATVDVGTSPYGVAVDPAGTRAYVVNTASQFGGQSVSVIDTATHAVVTTVALVLGTPRGIAVNPTGTRAYVTNGGNATNFVEVIDTTTNTVVATVPVGANPLGIAVTSDGARAYVANSGSNNVSVIDTASNAVVATVAVGSAPQAFGLFIGGAAAAPLRVVTPSAGTNGAISPSTPQSVSHGATTTFTVTPDTGYVASVAGSCGGSLAGTTYTTNAIVADCTVAATFVATTSINAVLEGWQQSPYVVTAGAGTVNATFNPITSELTLDLSYTDLGSAETMAHIHGPAARAANAGVLHDLFPPTTSPRTKVVTLTAPQVTMLQNGQLYVNVHTVNFGSGEIRGQLDNLGATATRGLTVVKAGAGTGTIGGTSEAGTVIACPGDCAETVPHGKAVALTAAPAGGSTFAGWSGACTGSGACNVTMDAAKTVTATFNVEAPPDPARLGNISTRMQVLTGNDVMIGGFVVGGSASKTVVVRARGPSLIPFGITNALANPQLQLVRSSDQVTIATNDDWQAATNAPDVTASGFAPGNDLEAAILINLAPGAYTAIVSGVGNGTGVGIVEVFEVDGALIPLANISTRGQVLTGNDVMIGGFVVQGSGPQTVVVRARGPSLIPFGITNALANPQLQLVRSSDQVTIATNDDWQSAANAPDVAASGFEPSDSLEAAILVTLQPGAYTAIVTGAGGGIGVGIVEVFAVPGP